MRGFTKSLIGRVLPLVAMFVLGGAVLTSCSQQDLTVDTSFALYYSGINEISPGTNISINPTYHGAKPSGFELLGIELNGLPYETECFVLDAESGAFSLQNTEQLPTGKYVIGIACVSEGVRYEYPEAISINMLKPVPDGIFVEPADLRVEWGAIVEPSAENPLPTAQIKTDGNRHVQIKKFELANVYKNGDLANDCKEWFEVHPTTGVFSIVEKNEAIEPAVYTFDFKLNTYIVGAESEDGIFRNALRLTVTSAPMALNYNPSAMLVEVGYAGKSAKPTLKGSNDNLVYTLKGVSPANTIGITVDDATGIVRFPETSEVKDGEQYVVSVTATNAYGSKDFDNVFTFNVTSFIAPITTLTYDDIAEVISGVSIAHPVKELQGGEVTFSLVDVPAGFEALTIDPATGVVGCKKGTELPVGEATITVNAQNVKGSLQAKFKINVVANPFRFTYVEWGNNLGLSPIEEYGAQFRIRAGEANLVVPIVKHDLPEGKPVSFRLINKTNGTPKMGATIDAESGTLTIKAAENKDAQHRTHFAVLEVTCGGDSEAAVTRLFPLFVDQAGARNGYIVEYTPFAIRVNPQKGGRSASPTVVSKADGSEAPQFTLDYRRNFFFYKLGGPDQHVEGKAAADTFLSCVWTTYFAGRGKAPNYGGCGPMSYYGEKNGANGRLGLVGAYVEPETLQLVVNPDKFKDDYGYGHGVVVAEMQCNVNNIDPVNTGGQNTFPLIIWLDPSYNK